jgi:hypothetical protein
VLVDLPTDIKQNYTFREKSNKSFEMTKEQRERAELNYFIVFYFFPVSTENRPEGEMIKNHISCDNVRPLSHPDW